MRDVDGSEIRLLDEFPPVFGEPELIDGGEDPVVSITVADSAMEMDAPVPVVGEFVGPTGRDGSLPVPIAALQTEHNVGVVGAQDDNGTI